MPVLCVLWLAAYLLLDGTEPVIEQSWCQWIHVHAHQR